MQYISFLGYSASFLILLSMMMKSIIKLRIINLIGASLFAIYGVINGDFPVIALNVTIAITNIYFLLIQRREIQNNVDIISIPREELSHLNIFKDNREEIEHFFGKIKTENLTQNFLVCNNDQIIGFLSGKREQNTFTIFIDFVLPPYRNFSIGKIIYQKDTILLTSRGIETLKMYSTNEIHRKYLNTVGFSSQEDGSFALTLKFT